MMLEPWVLEEPDNPAVRLWNKYHHDNEKYWEQLKVL
jgi:hypothetical protein